MRKTLINLLFISLAASAGPLAYAQARPATGSIELKNIAEVEIEVKGADGKVEKKRAPVEKAIPGTVVFYTSTFKNISAKPASNRFNALFFFSCMVRFPLEIVDTGLIRPLAGQTGACAQDRP